MTSQDHPVRFRPPIAGASTKTGWEALEKWVGGGSGGNAASAETAAPAASGKTGWEALDKWVGGSGGGAPAAESAAPASGKTGWEALDKWVGGGGPAAAEAAPAASGKTGWEALDKWVGTGGEKVERAVDTVQERAAELKEDLKEIREKLPMDDIGDAGKGFFAALKKLFRGK